MLEVELAARSSVVPPVSWAVALATCSSLGIDDDSALTLIMQPELDGCSSG
jgi:hypothetical protein